MAKKKLFGNRNDPRCETCSFGKPTVDGTSVLCRRGGVVPSFHHCRHYQYDPLKRVPYRQKQPAAAEFTAADFALDDLVMPQKTPAENPAHDNMLEKLRSYLNDHDSPDVDGIMAILSEDNNPSAEVNIEEDTAIEVEQELLDNADTVNTDADAAACEETDTVSNTDVAVEAVAEETKPFAAPPSEKTFIEAALTVDLLGEDGASTPKSSHFLSENTVKPEEQPALEESSVDADSVVAQSAKETWHPDNTLDIEADLRSMDTSIAAASAKAALTDIAVQLIAPEEYEDDDDESGVFIGDEDVLTYDTALDEVDEDVLQYEDNDDESGVSIGDEDVLMYDSALDEFDEDVLQEDDLIFLSDTDLDNATIETLSMNEDGSFRIGTEEL